MTSCGTDRPITLTPDAARLADCPRDYPQPPQLPAMAPFTLADGRRVVLLSVVTDREGGIARFIIDGRGAWQRCASAVTYVEEWGVAARAGE